METPDGWVAAEFRTSGGQAIGIAANVADSAAFLCSDRATYITNASLDINGGNLTI